MTKKGSFFVLPCVQLSVEYGFPCRIHAAPCKILASLSSSGLEFQLRAIIKI